MESDDRSIAILAPLEEAFELMQKILFQPFDLTKWLIIGFAAWIATFFSGGGASFRSFAKGEWRWESYHPGPRISIHHVAPWMIPLLLILVIVALGAIIALMWIN